MSFNLANKTKEEMDKLYVDKDAAGVAFKERYNQPVIAEQVAAPNLLTCRTIFSKD